MDAIAKECIWRAIVGSFRRGSSELMKDLWNSQREDDVVVRFSLTQLSKQANLMCFFRRHHLVSIHPPFFILFQIHNLLPTNINGQEIV